MKFLIILNFSNSTCNPYNQMQRYKCTICGYVYDPEEGDPDGGIPPGTLFEDIQDDWTCPVCGVQKSDFEEEW